MKRESIGEKFETILDNLSTHGVQLLKIFEILIFLEFKMEELMFHDRKKTVML